MTITLPNIYFFMLESCIVLYEETGHSWAILCVFVGSIWQTIFTIKLIAVACKISIYQNHFVQMIRDINIKLCKLIKVQIFIGGINLCARALSLTNTFEALTSNAIEKQLFVFLSRKEKNLVVIYDFEALYN